MRGVPSGASGKPSIGKALPAERLASRTKMGRGGKVPSNIPRKLKRMPRAK